MTRAAARQGARFAAGALAFCLGTAAALAQTGAASGGVPLASQAEGALIARVDVVVTNDGGNPARAQAVAARLSGSLGDLEGRNFSRALVERRIDAARSRLGAGALNYTLALPTRPGDVALRIELDLSKDDQTASSPLVILRTDRAFLTGIVAGGLGAYSDPNVWFGRPDLMLRGNPLAGRLPGRAPAWTEGYVEYGVAGAVQLGDSPLYAYGALSGLTSWSRGQDFFRADARTFTGLEKAYGGLVFVSPETGNSLNVSFGRQNFTLNDGFLVHFVRGSANAGMRAASYVGARQTTDFSAIADGKFGPWSFKAFYIDPDELPRVDSRSTFAGLNLRYAFSRGLSVDASFITIPHSNSSFATPSGARLRREGLKTLAGHMRWNSAFGVDGLWLGAEIAHQTHDRYPMSAWAGYGLIGYQASSLPWSPSLSYRYSHATGDNPGTRRYERFDSLLSTGLGNWLQGVVFGKITSNSNLAVHRLQFNLAPTHALNLTFDWHLLRAPERNNLGANPVIGSLTSSDIGQEFTASARWAINRNLYLQNIVSLGVPGRALRDAGLTRNWVTLQSSLYWTF